MSIPMPSASNLLANSAIGDLAMNEIEKKQDSAAVKLGLIKSINELKQNDEHFITLQEDLKQIHEMTLVDDEKYLHSLYVKSSAFTTKEFLCNYLIRLYSSKYEDLIIKYPSIQPWLAFCVATCVSYNEGHLKTLCCSDAIKTIRLSSASTFKLVTKRRAPQDNENAKRAKLPDIQNPLFENAIYTTHKILFNIGSCANYCVPSEFGSLFLSMMVGNVSRISSGNQKETVEGYKATLTRTIICSLQSRETTEYPCYRVAYVEDLLNTVTKLTGHPVNFNQLSIGIKKTMMRRNMIGLNLEPTKIQGDSQLAPNKHYFCMLNNFQATLVSAENQVLSLRAYVNDRFEIDNSVFEPSDRELETYDHIIEKHCDELERKYAEYERLKREADASATD